VSCRINVDYMIQIQAIGRRKIHWLLIDEILSFLLMRTVNISYFLLNVHALDEKYIIGGNNNDGNLDTIELYTLVSGSRVLKTKLVIADNITAAVSIGWCCV
jgi:hypothetical protein